MLVLWYHKYIAEPRSSQKMNLGYRHIPSESEYADLKEVFDQVCATQLPPNRF